MSNATYSYSVDNLFKHQFEVTTPGCTYFFQANSQDAMFQWINALQVSIPELLVYILIDRQMTLIYSETSV